MNVMGRFTLRSMRANRNWTAVTLVGIIISTAMLAAVSTFCVSVIELMRRETVAESGDWHAMIPGVKMKDVGIFEAAGFDPQVTVGRDAGYARLENSQNERKPYLFIREFGADSYQNFPVELAEGRLPENGGELLLSQYLETNGGVSYRVGDTLTLEIGKRINPSAPEGFTFGQKDAYQGKVVTENGKYERGEVFVPEQTRTYTVVGIMKRPGYESAASPGYLAVTALDEAALGPEDAVTVTLRSGAPRHSFFDEVTELARQAGVDSDRVQFNKELLRFYFITPGDNVQNMIYGFAAVFVGISLLASVSLIYNAFAISVSERVTQLGMLASVGATRRQKRRSVYFEGFLLGAAGIPLGILFGIAGIGVTLSAIRPLLEGVLNLRSGTGLTLCVSFASVAAAAGLAALTIFVSAWVPARRASRVMPIDAIRQSKEVRLTRRAVKTSRLTRTLFGFEGEIALKNLKRSRKKYRATVLSLVISLVLFLTVSFYAQELQGASDAIEIGYNFDFAVSYMNVPAAEAAAMNEKIRALEGVGEASALVVADATLKIQTAQLSDLLRRIHAPEAADDATAGMSMTFNCPDDAAFDRYVTSLGADPREYKDPVHPKLILINYGQTFYEGKRTAGAQLAVRPGDTLRFTSGAEDAAEITLEVGLLTEKRPMGVLVSYLGNASAVVSREVYDSLPDDMKYLDSSGNPNYQQLVFHAENADGLEPQIQKLLRGMSDRTHILDVAESSRSEHNMLLVLGIFIYGFIILISLICIANIFNTVTTNVALRRREFAMLRSVGMTPKSFNRMIRYESVFYGLKALLYGLPISFAVALLLHNLQADVFDFGFALPWVSYAVAVVLIFIIVGATMLYSSAKVKKENIIDALKAGIM